MARILLTIVALGALYYALENFGYGRIYYAISDTAHAVRYDNAATIITVFAAVYALLMLSFVRTNKD